MTKIAIIGAGMAGLAAAERLRAHGIGCVIFDKSRGFGGRMATRRTGDLQFDHGAQYFTARGADFAAQVARWREAGQVDEWSAEKFVGTPGMTAPVRAMAAHHDCIMEAQVTRLVRGESGWTIHDYRGSIATPHNGAFAAVILAVPAPQAAPLAESAGAHLPAIAQARYAPCIALMLAFAPEAQRPAQDQMRPEDTAIAWIARNSSKPGRPKNAQTWVIHARPDWSRVHLEHNAEDLRAPLLARFRAVTGVHAEPTHVSAHRWRFALVEQDAGAACLFDEKAMVGACGDWCLGPRVESAYDSGCAMADTLLRALS
jgi:predicted NAD/FAD-dependent oxidoreductase